MTGNLRRAGVFAAIGLLSLVAPAIGSRPTPRLAAVIAALPFLAVAGAALFLVDVDSDVFDLLARPTDYEEGRLYGLAGFALAAGGLAIVATRFGLPPYVFVGTVFILTLGTVGSEFASARTADTFLTTAAFVAVGTLGGLVGELLSIGVRGLRMEVLVGFQSLVFFAVAGALTAALLRQLLFEQDDPLVLLSVALLLWLFVGVGIDVGAVRLGVGLVLSTGLGYLAYELDTASVPGMLTGVLLALLAIVLGGYGWFVMLVTFYGLGGLASKFRYEEKKERGIAEANEGARGTGNVLANSAVALVAVIAFAASEHAGLPPELFRFAFAGAVATALADTFSSEFGGLFDAPRLVTTLERVDPGTDGAVTWQGEVAGIVGAGLIAAIAFVFFPVSVVGAGAIVVAGFVGMTADSVIGATLEGDVLGNQSVNLLATLAGALACALFVLV